MMFELKALKVKGFRGYTEEQDFTFDNPVVLLFGENHLGKSSTLNAIEWCVFGNECVGRGTGIRERVDWEIPNRNKQPTDVSVELELKEKETGSKLAIKRKWVSSRKDELEVIVPDGQSLTGEVAKEKLAQLLQTSFRDFLTTVYQHQEAIRAVLTQEPKVRNEAIDRLLGLSDYRNILRGVEAAKLARRQRDMEDAFDGFAHEIDVALRTQESHLKDKRAEAGEEGIGESQLNEKGVLEIGNGVKDQLLNFASEIGLSIADLEVPEQWTDLYGFREMADAEIKRFRSEMPDVKKQQELFTRLVEITAVKEKYKQKERDWNSVKNEYDINETATGKMREKARELEKKIPELEKERSEVSARGAVIREAINYLELEGIDTNVCPVCGTKKLDLLGHLRKEWVERYENIIGKIQDELERCEKRRCEVKAWFEEYDKVKKRYEDGYKGIRDVRKEISEMLDREIADKDDVDTIINNVLEEANKELRELEQAVKSKQETLDGIVSSLEQMQLVVEILSLEKKKKIVEQIQESSEYRRMEELRDQMAILVDDVQKIKLGIREASHEAAKQKVAEAGKVIDNYFQMIVNNPSVRKIEFDFGVDTRGFNSYVFKNQNGEDLTPILSQGDLNAMALSIFLGMACSGGTNQGFGFVMLDDPSQSLGFEHKKKLVEVLDEVLKERMVVLSSMDKELQDLVLSKITKAKTKYMFSDWTPEDGPVVKKE